MNQVSERPFTAYIGIDWASSKHDICLQVAGSEDRIFDRITHTPEAIETWAQALYQRFGGPIAVALELSEGPIVSALQKYDFLILFPIDPKRLARYREAFTPSGAKDDPTDAEFATQRRQGRSHRCRVRNGLPHAPSREAKSSQARECCDAKAALPG